MSGPRARKAAAALILGLAALSFSVAAALPRAEDDVIRRVDAVFADWDKTTTPGMSLAVVRGGRIVHARGYGLAGLEWGVLNGPDSVFDIGSISKQFTAAAVHILDHQGRLRLDDDIRTYLPEMPRTARPVTIRQLIHHTSGVRDYEVLQWLDGELTDQGWHTNRDLLELIARQKGLNFMPGERFQYSNSGYTLLAVIVERVSGRSLGAFLKERVFEPLGMSRTFVLEDNRVVIKNRARGYTLRDGRFVLDETLNESTGDGAVQTTVLDFALWDRNFGENRLEVPDFLRRLEEPGKLADGRPVTMPGADGRVYASGLVLGSYRGLRTVGHGGAYVGYRAGYLRFPDQAVSIILLANVADINPMTFCERVADVVLETEFREPRPPSLPPPAGPTPGAGPGETALPAATLAAYAGEYVSEELRGAYVLSVRDGALRFNQVNPPSTEPLRIDGDDLFGFGGLQIKFRRDRRNRVEGFSIVSDQAKGLSFRKIR